MGIRDKSLIGSKWFKGITKMYKLQAHCELLWTNRFLLIICISCAYQSGILNFLMEWVTGLGAPSHLLFPTRISLNFCQTHPVNQKKCLHIHICIYIYIYPGCPKAINSVVKKKHYFSRDLFHHQFQGIIILMVGFTWRVYINISGQMVHNISPKMDFPEIFGEFPS